MDRLNRMLQAAQGMSMGGAAPGGVSSSLLYISLCALSVSLLPGMLGRPCGDGSLRDYVLINPRF